MVGSVGRHYGATRYAGIALVWAILETLIIVSASIPKSPSFNTDAGLGILRWPLSIGLFLVFGLGSFVGSFIGDDLEALTKVLFSSQIIAVPLSSLLAFVIAPPIDPGISGLGNYSTYEMGYFLALGLMLFMISLAGGFSGWLLNSLVGSNREFSLDWKRLALGLGLAAVSISLPISPLGVPIVALCVAGIAFVSVLVVRSGLNKRIPIAPRPVGLLLVSGILVFFLSVFSVSYILWSRVFDTLPILIWVQGLTLIAPSLVLFRLLIRSLDPAEVDHSSGWDRRKIP